MHMLGAEGYCGSGEVQLRLLRRGHEEAWRGQGPEVLLLNVLLELREVIAPYRLPQVGGGGGFSERGWRKRE